jgi:Zn finger protein HypA/HybF involved in hydrogenase expression
MSTSDHYEVDLAVTCWRCERRREWPDWSEGVRNPICGDSVQTVDNDTPCPQCGTTRCRVTVTPNW